jgi:hypothetical protein
MKGPITEAQAMQEHMFGCTVAVMQDDWNQVQAMYPDRPLYIMSILSDAQEAMAYGNTELARQWINKAKWHLQQMMGGNNRG